MLAVLRKGKPQSLRDKSPARVFVQHWHNRGPSRERASAPLRFVQNKGLTQEGQTQGQVLLHRGRPAKEIHRKRGRAAEVCSESHVNHTTAGAECCE